MKIKELPKIMNYVYELIAVFTDYSVGLDKYFANEKNRTEHKELFEEYQILNSNIKVIRERYRI